MKKLIILCALIFSAGALKAQILNPVKWSYGAKKGSDGTATLFFKANIDEGWHIYSVNQGPGGPKKTEIILEPSAAYVKVGKAQEPKPEKKYEDAFGINVYFFKDQVIFQQKIKLKAGQTTVKGKIGFMVCTDKQCLPPDEVSFSIPVN
jgi:hypothetical protein